VAESVAAERKGEATEDEIMQLDMGLTDKARQLRELADELDEIAATMRRIKDTKEVLEKLKGLLD
tara:strand:- start:207 stop:401 length:195 start_codon:yes stop_codon:yes gene_type:complete